MKAAKTNVRDARRDSLRLLKQAIIEGASWRYEHLVALAQQAGATDDEIDQTAHQALQALLDGAELPLTSRELSCD